MKCPRCERHPVPDQSIWFISEKVVGAASTAKFTTMSGLAPLYNWLPVRSLCKVIQLSMQIPRVADSTSSITEDQSLMQELGNENL